jgi:hypothetical protein
MKHTPGPWGVHGSHIYAPDGAIIAQVYNPGSKEQDYPLVANRNLMAAAPDMLALLSDLTTAWDASRLGDGGHHAMIRRAHAIIARVEGGAA